MTTSFDQPLSATEEAILREIEAIVRAAEAEDRAAAPQTPDLDAVAEELGISVDDLHDLRETGLS